MRWKLFTLLLPLVATPGCYLAHLADGQLRLLRARQPIDRVLADPDTPSDLRDRLTLVQQARGFAEALGLDVGSQYTSFVAWPGDRVVTTIVATRPGEITPAGFRFPLIGVVPYKGFFDPERAAAEAERLRAEGLDVCEVGVRAYSTLGWLDDPVTEPMLQGGNAALVDVILHELVHATVYVRDEADFNEGVASFIGQEGSVRFFQERGADATRHARERVEDRRRTDAEVLRLSRRIAALYEDDPAGPARDEARRAAEAEARGRIAALTLRHGDARQLSTSLRLNDACLALTGTYAADLADYAQVLERLGGDLEAFVARLREAAESDDPRGALLAEER